VNEKENTCLPLSRQKRGKCRAVVKWYFYLIFTARAGSFAPAGATKGFALWKPKAFEKACETFNMRSAYTLTTGRTYGQNEKYDRL